MAKQFLRQCLSPLMSQAVKPHEVNLVDSASTDGSLDIVRGFPSVRLMALNENTGFARGNNLAIEAASTVSDWIGLHCLTPIHLPNRVGWRN